MVFGIAALSALFAGLPAARVPIARYLESLRISQASTALMTELSTDWVLPVRIHSHVTPASVVTRGGHRPERSLTPDATIALATLEKLVSQRSDPRALQAIAIADLTQGRYARAVAGLERARIFAPADPGLLTDLSAAYFMRHQPNDLLKSLDLTVDGLSRDPRNPALLFNYARIADRVLTREQADAAWKDYLSTEPDSAWKERDTSESRTIVPDRWTPDFQTSRDELLEQVLPALASVCASGSEAEAPALRSRAWSLVELMSRTRGESGETRATVTALAGPRCDRERAAQYTDYYGGLAPFRQDQFEKARAGFDRVTAALEWRDHPLAIEAASYASIAGYLSSGDKNVLERLDRAASAARRGGAFDALGRAERFRGYVLQDRGNYTLALEAYRSAIHAFSQSGDINNFAVAHSLVADVYDSFGDYQNGQRENETALGLLPLMTDSRSRYTITSWAQRVLMRDGLPHAATVYARATAAEPSTRQSVIRGPRTLVDLANLEMQTGDRERASRTLADALSRGQHIESEGARLRFNASVLAAKASLARGTPQAIGHLSSAMDAYRQAGSQILFARLALLRGRAYLAGGDRVRAEQDFENGILAFENGRPTIDETRLRLSYFEESWPLFEELIGLLVGDGRFDRALEVADRGRARELRTFSTIEPAAAMVARIRSSMAPSTRVLYYVALDDRLIVWVIGADAVRHVVVPVKRVDLQAMVAAFVAKLQGDAAQPDATAAALYNAVMSPIEGWISSSTHLVVVPDAVLQPLPFAALTGRDQHYLMEQRDMSVLPALRGLNAHPSGTRRAPESVLAVGDPATPVEGLPPLPGARGEAEDVASLYPRRETLLADAATKARFVERLPRFDVLHFAGHAIVNPESPDLSRLMLAGSADQDNTLFAHEIARLPLAGVHVAVLAACETATGRTYRSEGTVSWGSAFLAAGVPGVVATLWKIDDRSSRALFRSLHEALRQGATLSQAVRTSQLAMLRGADRDARAPRVWAALTAIQSEN